MAQEDFKCRLAQLLGILLLLSTIGLIAICHGEPGPEPAPAAVSPYIAPRGYVCYRAPGPIKIDGKLDDPAWAAAPWSEDFVDIEGIDKPKPTYRTRVKMLWDDACLYIGVELEEPHVWATAKEHDSYIFHFDPDFEVFLDPDGDSHLYAELEMNALNTTWDLLLTKPYKDGGKAIDAWEIAGLRTAVHVDGTINDHRDKDRGWSIEIAWPWRGLKQIADCPVPPRNDDQWRMNFSRVEWDHDIVDGKYHIIPKRPEHNWIWSPQHIVNMHSPERWGYVQFSTAAPGTGSFVPDPAAQAKHLLHQVYEAQTRYLKKNKEYATNLRQLGLSALSDKSLSGGVELQGTSTQWQANVSLTKPGKGPSRWHIQHDARIWGD